MNASPPRFLWGAATSAYQVEGAVAGDARAGIPPGALRRVNGDTHAMYSALLEYGD